MNTLRTNRNWKRNVNVATGVVTLALAAILIPATPAKADVKIDARLNTPHLDVRVRSKKAHKPYARPHVRPSVRQPVRVVNRPGHITKHPAPRHYYLTKQDRRIAKRMARLTGYRKGRILNLRRQGYTWREIGYRLDIPRRVVFAAVNGKRGPRWTRQTRHEPGPEVCVSPYGR